MQVVLNIGGVAFQLGDGDAVYVAAILVEAKALTPDPADFNGYKEGQTPHKVTVEFAARITNHGALTNASN